MKVQADLFPFQADSIDYHHPLDESGERPNACCPACKGQLTFQDIDHGPDVLVGTITEPSATAICTACGTLYTLRYVTRQHLNKARQTKALWERFGAQSPRQ